MLSDDTLIGKDFSRQLVSSLYPSEKTSNRADAAHVVIFLKDKRCAWGAVAQWIERATDNRVVARSNPTETAWKLWQFPLPHFASVFRKRQ